MGVAAIQPSETSTATRPWTSSAHSTVGLDLVGLSPIQASTAPIIRGAGSEETIIIQDFSNARGKAFLEV